MKMIWKKNFLETYRSEIRARNGKSVFPCLHGSSLRSAIEPESRTCEIIVTGSTDFNWISLLRTTRGHSGRKVKPTIRKKRRTEK